MLEHQFEIGDIVEIADEVDPENQPTEIATVRYIEQDNDFPELFWIYLIANEEVLNMNAHPAFGFYWKIIPNTYDYIRLVSKATVS